MPLVKRYLSRLVIALLAWQVTAAAVAPLALAGRSIVEEVCTCPGALPGATCPMHHSHHSTGDENSTDRTRGAMRSTTTPAAVVMLSLVGQIGVMPQRFLVPGIVFTHVAIIDRPFVPFGLNDIPDPPPPRS